MNDEKPCGIRAQMRAGIAQEISTAIIGVVVSKGAVRCVIEMKTESAAVICNVTDHLKFLAVIAQESIHLMLQIVVMNSGV